MSDKKQDDDEKFDFWNPKYYEHDDIMFPWRKEEKIPGVNAPPIENVEQEKVRPKKEKKGCLSALFGGLL